MTSLLRPRSAAGIVSWAFAAALATVSVAAEDKPTAGLFTVFAGDGMRPLDNPDPNTTPDDKSDDVSVPLGWNIPGGSYQTSGGWWSLSCASRCRLDPARLHVRQGTHPTYDGPDTPSQLLTWNIETPPSEGNDEEEVFDDDGFPMPKTLVAPTTIMIFQPPAKAAKRFSAGAVRTWLHAGMGSYPDGEHPERMETEIDLGPDGKALVMPRILPPDSARTAQISHRGYNEDHNTQMVFELRAYGRRQRLGTYAWDIEGAYVLDGPMYLRWAGDLDRDGKLDLLMSYAGRGWDTVLYLSSLAASGEIVGEAGRFVFWPPNDPGC